MAQGYHTAGGMIRRGSIPNPAPYVGMFVNPESPPPNRKRNDLYHQMATYSHWDEGRFPEVKASGTGMGATLKKLWQEKGSGSHAKLGTTKIKKLKKDTGYDERYAALQAEKSGSSTKASKKSTKQGAKPMSKKSKKRNTNPPVVGRDIGRDASGKFVSLRRNNPKGGKQRDDNGLIQFGQGKGKGKGRKPNPPKVGRDIGRDASGKFVSLRRDNPKGVRRYNQEGTPLPPAPTAIQKREEGVFVLREWKDAIEPVAAATISFALPGILDVLTHNWFTDTLEGVVENFERSESKAQALFSLGSFIGVWMLTTKVEPMRKYRIAALTGSGVRFARDLLDAILGTEKETTSGTIRQMFGITGALATKAPTPETATKIIVSYKDNALKDAAGKAYTASKNASGQLFDSISKAALMKADGPQWTETDYNAAVAAAKEAGGGAGYVMDRRQRMQGWHYASPVGAGPRRLPTGSGLTGWSDYQPASQISEAAYTGQVTPITATSDYAFRNPFGPVFPNLPNG